ncbi:phosphonate ABC transporter ATP-binding protein [Halegenticoccus tardaugens]|uniref:phosphonate ABC transporter ATP-binding protein n=1 Tax=Halegenticoccus tardaugens TaxID=2071624 RepID=UPI00100ACA8E|nr:phosphonate ABC transporter ATP-binding protein [Halegenticoccus tardaugens]
MSTLTVRNLTKRYGDVTALRDVSFEIDDDEFAVLLGESGAGKSTLLRCVNGLTEPTEGEIRLDGEPLSKSRSDVAMIFQRHNLIEPMTAYSNALTGALHRTSLAESVLQRHDEADELAALSALDTVGLLAAAHQPVANMSGGQRQRVGIARALVQDPGLLLADEPVASLDPSSAETVMTYLKRASREHGIATLASLHQVNIARYFGDRFLGLRDGRLVFDGRCDELTYDVIDELYGEVETVGLGVPGSETRVRIDGDPVLEADGSVGTASGRGGL